VREKRGATTDGRSLVFDFGEWVRKGPDLDSAPHNLYRRPADASQAAERLTTSPNAQAPMSISPDGRLLAFVENTAPADESGGGLDIWMLPLDGERTPRPWLATRAGETHPAFSPDGRYVAYASRESGGWQVMVRAFEGRSPVEQVSVEGGWEPLWSRDGKEILFRSEDGKKIFAASFEAGPRPRDFLDEVERKLASRAAP
jgi:Tol biopolymer transport system component